MLPNYTADSSFESLLPAVEFYMADMEPKNLSDQGGVGNMEAEVAMDIQ